MPELAACIAANCPSAAATILTDGITRILDIMARVRTIQNRKNFAPYLSTDTKTLQSAAKTAQEIAANSGRPEDWRQYRALRNQKNRSVLRDKEAWQHN